MEKNIHGIYTSLEDFHPEVKYTFKTNLEGKVHIIEAMDGSHLFLGYEDKIDREAFISMVEEIKNNGQKEEIAGDNAKLYINFELVGHGLIFPKHHVD